MNQWNEDQSLDGTLLAQASGFETEDGGALSIPQNGSMQRTGNAYTTAIRVQEPRDSQRKSKMLLAEAKLAGEAFYYGWGTGKDRIIGPSIGLASAAARVWGNCALDMQPVQETEDAWVFTAVFVDLETGFTLARQFRQSKGWQVHGRFDVERKDDIRFQIGQSKATRNVIVNALPKWLLDQALKEAQAGVRERIERFVEKNGLAAAVDLVIDGLKKQGVPEAAILDKCQIVEAKGMHLDHVVMLRGDLYALQEGQDRAENLFPALNNPEKKTIPTSAVDAELEGDVARRRVLSEVETVAQVAEAEQTATPEAAETVTEPAQPSSTGDADGAVSAEGQEAPDAAGGDTGLFSGEREPLADEVDDTGLPPGFIEELETCEKIRDVNACFEKHFAGAVNQEQVSVMNEAVDARKEAIRARR